MKIIIEGKEERSQRVKCEKCEAVYDIKKEDLTLEKVFTRYTLYTFNCPCCGTKDYTRNMDLPFKV